MPVETTVLLVDASTLPSSLEEQLTRRSVFAEHAAPAQVEQVIPVVAPDLLLQSGKSQLSKTIEVLAATEHAPPLVVIADRATIRKLREEAQPQISALIPQDLPVAAIAHRIATMARRSSQGEPLEHKTGAVPVRPPMATLAGMGAPDSVPSSRAQSHAPESKTGKEPETDDRESDTPPQSTRGSLAPLPLAGSQSVKILDADEEQAKARIAAKKKAAEEAAAQKKAEAEAKRQELKQAAVAQAEARREKEKQAREKRAAETKARQEELRKKRETEAKERQERARKKKEAEAEARKKRSSERPKRSSTAPRAANTSRSPGTLGSVPPPSEAPSLASRSSYRPAPIVEHEAEETPPSTELHPAQPLRNDDELSVVAPLPVDIRLPLSGKRREVSTIRLALLDTDLTRADSVAAALRREGMEIFPVTPQVATTRWPMLRRFAPQGLLVDEKSMVRGAAEWVETFRGDFFLRHVPVVLMRFSRLFRDDSGEVDLEPLMPLIEPLGKEEVALLDKLKPGRQVDLRSSQIPPFRLVQLLTEQDRNTRLDCLGGNERIVWPLGPGYAGKAKLLKVGSDKVLAKLSAEDSMTWLLSHDDCSISVHEHTEPLAHASQSKDSQVLLNEMTEAVGTPSRHQSVPPGPSSSQRKGSIHPGAPGQSSDSEEEPNASQRSLEAAGIATTLRAHAMPEEELETEELLEAEDEVTLKAEPQVPEDEEVTLRRSDKPAPPVRQSLRPSPEPQTPPPSGAETARRKAHEFLDQGKSLCLQGWSAYQERLKPLESKIPARSLYALSIILPALALAVMFLVLINVALSTPQSSATESAKGTEVPTEKAEPTQQVAKEPQADEKKEDDKGDEPEEAQAEAKAGPSDALWKVGPDTNMATCKEKLGPAAPTVESPARSISYWKQARRLLMMGKTDQALEMMCLAGLFDPAGPAAEGLAEYYLAQRSLAEAERWVKLSLKADSTRRKSLELQGDIESQKGNPEKALKIWLDTMRLDGSETAKMQAISRKFMQDSKLARRGGDLPRAERTLRRAAAMDPSSAVISAELAELFLQREVLASAAQWAERSRKLDPNFAGAKILSGRIAEAAGKANEARDFYRSVPPGDPSYSQAQKRLERVE